MYVCMFIVLCRDHMYNLSLLSLPQMLPHSRHSPRGTIPHTTHRLPLPIPFHKHTYLSYILHHFLLLRSCTTPGKSLSLFILFFQFFL